MSRHNRQNREQRSIVDATNEATSKDVIPTDPPTVEPDDALDPTDDVHGWRVSYVCAVCNEPYDPKREHSTAMIGGRCLKCGSANFRESVEAV